MAPVKKPQSAYFHFSNERRKAVMAENAGARVGDIQKIIGAQWKALTPEEKGRFVELAAKDKARYEQEKLDNPVIVEEPAAEEQAAAESSACVYPLGRVKKIVQSDPDVGKISREALIAIAKASELFAQFLGTKSYEQAMYRNKRQIKTADVTRSIQTTASLDWLREDFPDVKPARPDAAAGNKAKETEAKQKRPLPDSASFFKPKAADETNTAMADE